MFKKLFKSLWSLVLNRFQNLLNFLSNFKILKTIGLFGDAYSHWVIRFWQPFWLAEKDKKGDWPVSLWYVRETMNYTRLYQSWNIKFKKKHNHEYSYEFDIRQFYCIFPSLLFCFHSYKLTLVLHENIIFIAQSWLSLSQAGYKTSLNKCYHIWQVYYLHVLSSAS